MQGCHNDGNYRNNRLENLRWDTMKSNFKDRDRHGRTARGEKNGGGSKLTENDVREIRRSYAECEMSQLDLGYKYGVSNVTISAIIRRKLWKHI